MKNKFFKVLLIVGIASYGHKNVLARGDLQKQEITPLQIGDTIPEDLWQLPLRIVNHPEGKDTVTLNEYRGKLIILDFWATWCTSCIAAMPKLQKIQNQFDNRLVILSSTYELADEIDEFLRTNQIVRNLNLPSIVDNRMMNKFFNYRLIPHYVWISTEGKVISTTSSDEVVSEKINAVLQNSETNLNSKVDINTDVPFFLQTDLLKSNQIVHYSLFFKGKYEGLGKGTRRNYSKSLGVFGLSLTNLPLYEIFFSVAKEKLKNLGESFTTKRIVMKFDGIADFKRDYESGLPFDKQYTYSIWIDSLSLGKQYDYMLEDLNRYSGYFGQIENRIVNCLELTRSPASRGGLNKLNDFNGIPIDNFVRRLNQLPNIPQLIFNGVDCQFVPDMPLPNDVSFTTLNTKLLENGLLLVKTQRRTNVFIISKKD